ncbi:MAG: T9SS type A sorting domain-containing protein [Bacteroidetes bacterium]|nr:T9SS type A sorting domain-containing protein [Bacteroidota bacterium]
MKNITILSNTARTQILLFLFFTPLFSVAQFYTQPQKVVASDRSSGSVFGCAVSLSRNYAVVGAQYESNDTSGLNLLPSAGAVYVFEKNINGDWIQKQKLVPADRASGDYFGSTVFIDSTIIAIGAYEKAIQTSGGYLHAGAVYLFERVATGNWEEKQKIQLLDTTNHNHFGYSLCIQQNKLIVGSPADATDALGQNVKSNAGAVFLFQRDSLGVWQQQQKLVAQDRDTTDMFGYSVSIHNDVVVVGAYREDEDANGQNTKKESGSVYVFQEDSSGFWVQQQKLVAPDRFAGDRFGVSVSARTNLIAIGAFLEDEDVVGLNTLSAAGSVYLFEKDSGGVWVDKQKIVALDRGANDYFGENICADGNRIIVGARNESQDSNGANTLAASGSAYVYEKNNNGVWIQIQKIIAPDRAVNDQFGTSVAIDNKTVLIGAMFEDEDIQGGNTLNGSGSAYFFDYCYESYFSFSATGCSTYLSPSGKRNWYSSGTYYDTLVNFLGCDSIVAIYLTIDTIDTTVSQNSNVLASNQINATYQWLDCNNSYFPIPLAIAQTYTTQTSGSYAVEISKGSCVDTSLCYTVNNMFVSPGNRINDISVFPNPFVNSLYIETQTKIKSIAITNVLGQNQSVDFFIVGDTAKIYLPKINSGLYVVHVYLEGGMYFNSAVVSASFQP